MVKVKHCFVKGVKNVIRIVSRKKKAKEGRSYDLPSKEDCHLFEAYVTLIAFLFVIYQALSVRSQTRIAPGSRLPQA